jgi:gluconokinase
VSVLVLDVGSSSVRSSLWDEQGNPEGEAAQLEHRARAAPDGTAELDPEALLDLVARALDAAMEHAPEVEAVAMSTFWHALLGLDEDGHPLTPIYSWADRRAAAAAARLRGELDEDAIHARTGCRLHSSYWPAKLAWLRESQPDLAERVHTWISPGEYVQRRLLGDATASISMASGTGMLDQRTCTWDEELTRGVEERLPPIDDSPRSGLTSEWAERWPGLREVPWFPAWGDGACSNLGSGCGTLERAALMVGTSGALRVLWRTEEVPEVTRGLWRYRADAQRVVVGGSLSDGGSVFAWLKRLTRLPDDDAEAERAIAAMEPDAHGLTVLPLLSGERGPGWSDAAGATIGGLTPATEPLDLLRASLEAVALRFRLIELELREALPGERDVVGTGGGLVKSPAWTQIMADALGRPVAMSKVDEGSSRGAALLALEALGHIERAEEVEAPLGETFEPDPEHTEAYEGAAARQVALYDAVTSMPAPPHPEGPAPVR